MYNELERRLENQREHIATLQRAVVTEKEENYRSTLVRLAQAETDAEEIAVLKRRCERLVLLNRLMMSIIGPPPKAVAWAWRPVRALTMLLSGK